MRVGEISRKTSETDIFVKVNLDGAASSDQSTGVDFLDHMLKSLATHSLIDLSVKAQGDLSHHTVEDVAICLGEAIRKALGDYRSITRFGYAMVPMDCSLALAVVDLSNRAFAKIDLKLRGKKVEDMPCEDIYHFLESLATSLRANIHVQVLYGSNDHHKVEAAFKALALSFRQAVTCDARRSGIPSSKGAI